MSFGVCSYMLRIAADVVALKATVEKVFNIVRVYSAPANANMQRRIKHHSTYLYFKFKNSNRILNVKTFDDF